MPRQVQTDASPDPSEKMWTLMFKEKSVPEEEHYHRSMRPRRLYAPESATSENGELDEEHKYTFWQAMGLNTMMMFGTGPFISIPLTLAATVPAGPQALIGYGIGAIACCADSFVWGELGSRWPKSGGSYVYLRESYGRDTWGKYMAFLYLWQFWISAPAEIASAFIAIAEYLRFIHHADDYWSGALTAAGLLIISIAALYRKVDDIGKVTMVLFTITIVTTLFTVVAGFANFNPENLAIPENAFTDRQTFIFSLSAACRLGIYDFTGYYDVCQMGGEVRNPRRTIPYSCIATCLITSLGYAAVYFAVIGYLPWDGPEGFVLDEESSSAIMGVFAERMIGKGFAYFFVICICFVIFGSAFSMICGVQHLPVAAAEDGVFFSFFAHKSEKYPGLPDHSLLTIGFCSFIMCFFSLGVVIDVLATMLILVQFMGQAVGLLFYRYRIMQEEDPEAWTMPLFPWLVIFQLVVFGFIFFTTENWIISGDFPLLDITVGYMFVGSLAFLVRQKTHKDWPFAEPVPNIRLSFYRKTHGIILKNSDSPKDLDAEDPAYDATDDQQVDLANVGLDALAMELVRRKAGEHKKGEMEHNFQEAINRSINRLSSTDK